MPVCWPSPTVSCGLLSASLREEKERCEVRGERERKILRENEE
jgi:hypothetical protein